MELIPRNPAGILGRVLYCILLVSASGLAASDHACPDIPTPPAPACVASAQGLAYADTVEEAASAARAQAGTAAQFEAHFGDAPEGLVVLSTSYDPEHARRFAEGHGLAYAQVWLSASAKQAMAVRAMRRAGLDTARIRRARAAMADQHENALRHEIGHAMYAARFWSGSEKPSEQRYGSPAPDWLDEAAAILMESVQSQGARASQFLQALRSSPGDIPPLSEFLQMEHPVMGAALARQLERGEQTDSGVQMMFSDENDLFATANFYGQSLLTGMFLIETGNDPRILATISAAIADGLAFADWIAEHGASHDLPDSLPALQATWEDWSRQLADQALDAG